MLQGLVEIIVHLATDCLGLKMSYNITSFPTSSSCGQRGAPFVGRDGGAGTGLHRRGCTDFGYIAEASLSLLHYRWVYNTPIHKQELILSRVIRNFIFFNIFFRPWALKKN